MRKLDRSEHGGPFRLCGWTDSKLPRVTKSVPLSGMLNLNLNLKSAQAIKTNFPFRQTISGEHGLDSNGVYVAVADSRPINPSLTAPIGTTAPPSFSSSA